MIKEEIRKVLISTKSRVVLLYLFVISILDAIYGISQSGDNGALFNIHPAFVSLLSGQSGIVGYALFVWMLPITLMLLYCDKYQAEKDLGAMNIYITKSSRKKFFNTKIVSAFIIPSLSCGVPLIINLLICVAFLYGNTSFLGLEEYAVGNIGIFLISCLRHPYIAWVGYCLVAMIVFGLLGVMCQSMCMIFNDNRIAYVVTFAIWITFFCFEYNIPKIIQPYTEYGIRDGLTSLAVFLPFVLFPLSISYIQMVVLKDEV